MNEQQREELVSAYLDGELSPEERADVERWLAEHPELRQLHDELLALRATLRALPRQKVGHDLAPAVLRRAEQAVLRGPGADESAPGPSTIGQWWLRGAGWRRLAWPAVAVAAALLIALFDREEAPERQVAQAPKGETSITARPAPADAKPSSAAPAEATEKLAGQGAAPEDLADKYVAPPSANLAAKRSATLPANDTAKSADQGAQLGVSAVPAPAAAAMPAAAAPPGESASPAAPSSPPPPGSASPSPGAPSPAPASAEPAGEAPRASMPAAVEQKLASLPADVECEVTAEFLRTKGFEKLLASQNVYWMPDSMTRFFGPAATRGEQAAADEAKQPAARPGSARQTYVVEASAAQVESLMAELRKDTAQVKRVIDQRGAAAQAKPPETTARGQRYRFSLVAEPAPVTSPEAKK